MSVNSRSIDNDYSSIKELSCWVSFRSKAPAGLAAYIFHTQLCLNQDQRQEEMAPTPLKPPNPATSPLVRVSIHSAVGVFNSKINQ